MLSSTLRRLSSVLFCLLFATSVQAGVLDLRLKVDQIFDVQWNISGGNLNASYFNYIYSSINYATQTTSASRWTAAQTADAGSNGRYIAFFNSTTNPGTYGMAVYNSDGSVYKIINNTGSFRALANGAIFYNGGGKYGTLITTEQSYSLGGSGSWAVIVDYPTNADLDAYVAPAYSSDQQAPPPPPTPVYSSGITQSQFTKRASKLADTASHGMEAHVSIAGNSNDVTVQQIGDSHYLELSVVGDSNYTNIDQTSTIGGTHFVEANIAGTNNSLDVLQTDTNKTAFIDINGNNNIANITQKDLGQHYLDLDLIGDGHNATILQEGSGNHNATVELTNGGGSWDFTLTQSGNISKEYSLPHAMSDGSNTSGTCYVSAGCSLTVTQPD